MKKTILTLFVIGAPFLLFAQNEIASQSKSNQYRTLKLPYDSDIREEVSESENIQMASTDSTANTPLGKKETRRRKVLMAERSSSSSRSKASSK